MRSGLGPLLVRSALHPTQTCASRRLAFAELRDTTHQYAAPLTFFFSTGSTPWVLSGSHEFAWLSWNGQLP